MLLKWWLLAATPRPCGSKACRSDTFQVGFFPLVCCAYGSRRKVPDCRQGHLAGSQNGRSTRRLTRARRFGGLPRAHPPSSQAPCQCLWACGKCRASMKWGNMDPFQASGIPCFLRGHKRRLAQNARMGGEAVHRHLTAQRGRGGGATGFHRVQACGCSLELQQKRDHRWA